MKYRIRCQAWLTEVFDIPDCLELEDIEKHIGFVMGERQSQWEDVVVENWKFAGDSWNAAFTVRPILGGFEMVDTQGKIIDFVGLPGGKMMQIPHCQQEETDGENTQPTIPPDDVSKNASSV